MRFGTPALGLCNHGEEGVDEFLGGCVPLVGAEEATGFQTDGTVRGGQEQSRTARVRESGGHCGGLL